MASLNSNPVTLTLPSHVFLLSYFFMALAIQAASLVHQYVWSWLHPTPSKRPGAVKMGVLVESSDLSPATVIYPATSHPNLILHAISAPDVPSAERLRKKYHFAKAYGSHSALLANEDIHAVYISAPIGLRFHVVEQALESGKHVLCDSPLAANAEEVRRLVGLAKEGGLVLLEGAHWQFHPAMHAWRKLVDSREYGRILRTEAVMACTPGIGQHDDRWKFDIAGGSAIALNAALTTTRFALHATTPAKLLSATARPSKSDSRIDAALHAHLIFTDPHNNPVHSKLYTDLARPWAGGVIPRVWELPSIEVETDSAVLFFYNFLQPHLYHFLSVTDKRSGETVYKKQYAGGPLWGNITVSTGQKGGHPAWSSFRWQLEAFVDAVSGKTPAYWVAAQESVWNMESVDAVYSAAGLPVRESFRDGLHDMGEERR